jgi:hypothetical protein
MGNGHRRAVRITIISIFFIAGSCMILLVCGFMYLMRTAVFPYFGRSGAIPAKTGPDHFLYLLLAAAVWSVGMLIASIGMLKRKNAFRLLFVFLLVLACAGFLVMGLDLVFKLGLMDRVSLSFYGHIPEMSYFMFASQLVQDVACIGACIVFIVLVMSPKASGDFKRNKEPSAGTGP